MAIGSAVQRGSSIYIYDEQGRRVGVVNAGSGPNDGLKGYTSSTVSVRRGNSIYIYDEKGQQKRVISAR
jgi:hypothetical protein